jgi:hypothetical protein
MAVDGAKVDCPARPAAWSEDVEPGQRRVVPPQALVALIRRYGGSTNVCAHVRRAGLRRLPSDTRNEMGNQGNKPFAGFILRKPGVLLNARVDIPRTDRHCFGIFFAGELSGVAVYGDEYGLYNLVEYCVDLFISQDRLEWVATISDCIVPRPLDGN